MHWLSVRKGNALAIFLAERQTTKDTDNTDNDTQLVEGGGGGGEREGGVTKTTTPPPPNHP